jgi:hypothetical protein
LEHITELRVEHPSLLMLRKGPNWLLGLETNFSSSSSNTSQEKPLPIHSSASVHCCRGVPLRFYILRIEQGRLDVLKTLSTPSSQSQTPPFSIPSQPIMRKHSATEIRYRLHIAIAVEIKVQIQLL